MSRFGTSASDGTKFASRHFTIAQGQSDMQIGVETSRAVDNKRVFVVDDDEITRAVLQFMLQDDNETHDLPTLADAFGKGQPDLLLLGLSVAAARGPESIEAIANRWPGTRILLIVPSQQDLSVQNYLRAGAHGILGKPFTVESVRQKVDIQLGRKVPSLIQLQLVPSGGQ
jgi:DNA-binding NarL/FixJ family response regulator